MYLECKGKYSKGNNECTRYDKNAHLWDLHKLAHYILEDSPYLYLGFPLLLQFRLSVRTLSFLSSDIHNNLLYIHSYSSNSYPLSDAYRIKIY
jgi:hypothetical protein